MKERLIEFLDFLNISQRKFEGNCGLSNGFVDKVGDSIRETNLKKISSIYDDLNINWLKTGEGEMLKVAINQNLENANSSIAIGRDANDSKILITSKNVDKFIQITEKYQEQTDRMLAIIENLINK
jgi:hypothetical protein